MSDLESYYYLIEVSKVRQRITEFKAEIANHGTCLRLSFLYDCLIELDLELIEKYKEYEKSLEGDHPYIERQLIAFPVPEIEKEIAKIEREVNFIVRGSQKATKGITQEMIERARDYPIENLIEVKRGKALCPFHSDHIPSLGVKNNRFYCFSCDARGDVIEFVMKKDGLSFKEAIENLIQ